MDCSCITITIQSHCIRLLSYHLLIFVCYISPASSSRRSKVVQAERQRTIEFINDQILKSAVDHEILIIGDTNARVGNRDDHSEDLHEMELHRHPSQESCDSKLMSFAGMCQAQVSTLMTTSTEFVQLQTLVTASKELVKLQTLPTTTTRKLPAVERRSTECRDTDWNFKLTNECNKQRSTIFVPTDTNARVCLGLGS